MSAAPVIGTECDAARLELSALAKHRASSVWIVSCSSLLWEFFTSGRRDPGGVPSRIQMASHKSRHRPFAKISSVDRKMFVPVVRSSENRLMISPVLV